MKNINQYIIISGLVLMMVSFAACKKDNYLTDGGLAQERTPYSTYDYLKSHKYQYFDTVIMMIDHYNLKDTVNKSGTFFAFTDFSVNMLMGTLQVSSLDSLYANVTSKLLTQYMFGDSNLTLANATTASIAHANWANSADALSAIKKTEGSYGVYLANLAPNYSYYTLQYVKVNGVIDGSQNAPPGDMADLAIPCQTSGIKTSSGTTLHVLANNAPLNKL